MFFFRWSMASECFRVTNFTITRSAVLVEFLPRGSLWQPSISIGDILISEPLQIFTTFSSRYWSGIWFKIPDTSTLLRRPYCSFFGNCFSRLTILFSTTLFKFFTIDSSLVSLALVLKRLLTLSERFAISLHRFWIWLSATTLPFFFSI